MDIETIEKAISSRLLVAITVHYEPRRLRFLASVLNSFAGFPIEKLQILIFTNTSVEEERETLAELLHSILPRDCYSIESYDNLDHPYDLTWCHKESIVRFARDIEQEFTHFIYVEDDIQLSFSNFCYFVKYRDILRESGLIPSFLRTEYSETVKKIVNVDNVFPVNFADAPYLIQGEFLFVNMPYEYIAFFILDRQLALDYIDTLSFQKRESAQIKDWWVRERAAMGLCFERIPNSFNSRYVVPVSRETFRAPGFVLVPHLGNNYADDPSSRLGKIRLDALFPPADFPHVSQSIVIATEGPDHGRPRIGNFDSSKSHRLERTLVCLIGQTRAHGMTWRNFKQNVLDELNADLALAIGMDDTYDYANPYWQHAQYRWVAPEYDDYGDGFDEAQRWLSDAAGLPLRPWRQVMEVRGNWLGAIKGPLERRGGGGPCLYFRWFLRHKLVQTGVLGLYDRFVISRSDFFWTCRHPPLSVLAPEAIWVPNGEFYGGLTDRHMILSRSDLEDGLGMIDDVVLRPDELVAGLGNSEINIETYLRFYLSERGMLKRTRFFPYVMFLVRGDGDPVGWYGGDWNEEAGAVVKYIKEYEDTKRWHERISSRSDWERLSIEHPETFRYVI